MRYLMLAAGMGSRFREAGFTQSKPFIEVTPGVPMYQWVLDSYGLTPADVDILVLKADAPLLDGKGFNGVHSIDVVSPGPAYSAMALALASEAPRHQQVMIFDCDCTAHVDLKTASGDIFRTYSSGVIAYEDAECADEYSFLNQPAVCAYPWYKTAVFHGLAEKSRVSDYINTGCYWFRSVDDLIDAFMTAHKAKVADTELPLSAVINAVQQPLHYFETNRFTNLGTPEHLAEFQRRQGAQF